VSTIGWVRGDDGSPGETWNPIRAVLRKDSPLRGRHRKNGDVGWFCVPVHEGCTNCYAGGMNQWRGNGLAYKAQLLEHVEFFLDENTLEEPLHWRKRAARLSLLHDGSVRPLGEGRMVGSHLFPNDGCARAHLHRADQANGAHAGLPARQGRAAAKCLGRAVVLNPATLRRGDPVAARHGNRQAHRLA
jgi:hypothetical protein